MHQIPYFRPPELDYTVLEEQAKYIVESRIYTKGPYRDELEAKLREYLGVNYVITCSSGTAALTTAMRVLHNIIGVDPPITITTPTGFGMRIQRNMTGSPCITMPAFNCPSDKLAAEMAGLKPAWQDINPSTWHSKYNHHITQGSVLLLDTFGSVDMHEYNVPHIIDATHSLGVPRSKELGIGSRGLAECFSLAASKPVTSGEGGFITTNNPEFARECREIADMCFRLPELSCVLALAYLEHLDDNIAEKHRIAEYYKKHLPYTFQEIPHSTTYSKIAFVTDTPEESEKIISRAAQYGVECRVYYKPLLSMKNSDYVYERIVCLPAWVGVDYGKVVDSIKL